MDTGAKSGFSQCIADDVRLGQDVAIYSFVNLYGCDIGSRTKIGTFVEIQKGARVGTDCKISSHTFICEGVTIEDGVFVGHSVVFINDRYPRATNAAGRLQTEADWSVENTVVRRGASIGSGSVILCNVTIGENAIVGAGSVVTKNVPANAVVAGNPARVLRYCDVPSEQNAEPARPIDPAAVAPACRDIRSTEAFRILLDRECACSDRNEHEFSLVVFDMSAPDAGLKRRFVQALGNRVRQTDEIGWLDSAHVGVLLAYTPLTGATTFAENVAQITGPPSVPFRVYTYPGQWLPDEKNPRPKPPRAANRLPVWKRAMDMTGSIIGLVLTAPLSLVVGAIIKICSPGPALLKQTRVGYQGREFTLWKFRTMHMGADVGMHQNHLSTLLTSDSPMTKLDGNRDPRIFPFGKVIRRCYVDELPQLINVLRGEMSLVGPRPCMPYEAVEYRLWQRRRFDAVPGMTGLWQVSGKNRTTFKEMIRLDINYARKLSLWTDIRILLRTLPEIAGEVARTIFRRNAAEQAVNNIARRV
jgi:lipopolysaccharide/colanic/teichoic acid biosynthesis glycosyltransferase/acetyltransferase-like isoleucine patch superfamily enzyme